MICKKCGALVLAKAKFCKECGSHNFDSPAEEALPDDTALAPAPLICPHCGDQCKPEAQFCDQCGYPFDSAMLLEQAGPEPVFNRAPDFAAPAPISVATAPTAGTAETAPTQAKQQVLIRSQKPSGPKFLLIGVLALVLLTVLGLAWWIYASPSAQTQAAPAPTASAPAVVTAQQSSPALAQSTPAAANTQSPPATATTSGLGSSTSNSPSNAPETAQTQNPSVAAPSLDAPPKQLNEKPATPSTSIESPQKSSSPNPIQIEEPVRHPAKQAPREEMSAHCSALLQRASLGDSLTPAEQTELRKCN